MSASAPAPPSPPSPPGGAPRTLWLLTDGKPGHRSQLEGLARALAALTPTAIHWIEAPPPVAALKALARRRFPPGADLPAPDLIACCGHATHLPALAARRARGGRLVALMKPSLPLACFDLCVIPQHDAPPAGDKVIATRGVLNTARTDGAREADRGLILIGGPSKHFGWDEAGLLAQLEDILAATPAMRWTLTTSRRTPASTEAALEPLRARGLDLRPFRDTAPGWAMQELARSAEAWVSEDSVSMVYESLSAGAATGLLAVPRLARSRVSEGVAMLIADGLVTPFAAWQTSHRLTPPPTPLAEADRVAREILRRWG